MVPGCTRLNSDKAWRQCPEESSDIVTPKLSAGAHRVYAMHLTDVLGDIQSDRVNLLQDGFP